MLGFQGVRRKRRIKQFFIGVILILITLWVLEGVWGQYRQNRIVREAYKEAELEMSALLERQGKLSEELKRLGTERGIEEELRSRFQIAQPGEKTVVIVDSKNEGEKDIDNEGLWNSLKNFFSL